MPPDQDTFWDELGIPWRATLSDPGFVSSRLEARMNLQSVLLIAGTIAATVLCVLGFALAAWALWAGWKSHLWSFITRGVTLAAVSLLALMGSLALRAGHGAETRSLRDMLQVSVARSQRLLRAVDLACYALLILIVGGLTGYALRIRMSRPPAISPVEDLLVVAVAGLALLWFRQSQACALRRYQHIRGAFESGDEIQEGPS